MPLFDDEQLARMEESLSGRAAKTSGGRPGAGAVVLVLLAAIALGAVVLLGVRARGRTAAASAEAGAPAGPSRAGEAAIQAVSERPRLEPPPPSLAAKPRDQPDAETESRRRFEERRSQLAETRPSSQGAAASRREQERTKAEAWWRQHAGSIEALDQAAARVVRPETTRIDAACADYIGTFEALLATDVRPAPTDGLATSLQRYLFFHTNAVASCRAARFLDVQAQLATWESASRSLEAAVADALSR